MGIEDEVERDINHLAGRGAELVRSGGQAALANVLEGGASGVFLEKPGGMPRGLAGGARQTVQGDRFGQVRFDEALHPFDRLDLFRVHWGFTPLCRQYITEK
ncbi:MAG: hypothetical protein WBK37_04675 [Kiritimatiellia bacterium]